MPKASGGELIVKLFPSAKKRTGQISFSQDASGKLQIKEPKQEDLVEGVAEVGSEKAVFYLPAKGPYSLKSSKTHSYENTSTAISVDLNADGQLTPQDVWWCSNLIRLGDAMFEVKEIDPGAKWIRLAKSNAPLAGLVVGKQCPPFSFKTTAGQTVTLASYKGKALLLDIWSMT